MLLFVFDKRHIFPHLNTNQHITNARLDTNRFVKIMSCSSEEIEEFLFSKGISSIDSTEGKIRSYVTAFYFIVTIWTTVGFGKFLSILVPDMLLERQLRTVYPEF